MAGGVDRGEPGPVLGLELLAAGCSSPGMVQRSLSGGSAIGVMPAMNVAPRSVSTPTEAPLDPWMWTLVWIPGFCDRLVTIEPEPAAAEPEDRDGRVLDLDVGWLRLAQ